MKSKIRNQIIHKTDWSKNRGDANGIWWYVHAGEKKGTLKQLKLTNVSLYKERHRNYFYHSEKKKPKGQKVLNKAMPEYSAVCWPHSGASRWRFAYRAALVSR